MDKAKVIELNTQWISDGIGDHYTAWKNKYDAGPINSAFHVFIESPTGTGKTSFILNTLLPYAASHNRSILYLGNRSALSDQFKVTLNASIQALAAKERESARANGLLVSFKDNAAASSHTQPQRRSDVLKGMERFDYPGSKGSLAVFNYQSFLSAVRRNKLNYIGLNNLYYIIFDEVHFFLEDALFNPFTHKIWTDSISRYSTAVLIFMSATLGEAEKTFQELEDRTRPVHARNNLIYKMLYKENALFYQNRFCGFCYNPIFFTDIETILPNIAGSPSAQSIDGGNLLGCRKTVSSAQKWLIFTNSKQKGLALTKKLKDRSITAAFLSGEKKGSKTWKQIVEKHRFSENVLVATKVLDNGVSIEDNSLQNIVLPVCDRAEFLQMLGRKRPDDRTGAMKTPVNVYIEVPTIQVINARLRQASQMSKAIARVQGAELPQAKIKVLQEYWLSKNQAIKRLFYINHKGYLEPNEFAAEKAQQLVSLYQDLKGNYLDPNYFKRKVLSWFPDGSLPAEYSQPETQRAAASLNELLAAYIDLPIAKDFQEAFYKEFQFHYRNYCKEQFVTNAGLLKKALSIHKATACRKATINHSLTLIGLPYVLRKAKNCWILQCTKTDEENFTQ